MIAGLLALCVAVLLLTVVQVISHIRIVVLLRMVRDQAPAPLVPIESTDERIARLRGTLRAAAAVDVTLTPETMPERLELARARVASCYAREELRRLGVEP